MLSIFRQGSKLSQFYRPSIIKNHQIMAFQSRYFTENFEEEFSNFHDRKSSNKPNKPRNFSRLESKNEQVERSFKSSIKSVLFKSSLDDILNYLKFNEINQNDYIDIANIMANRFEGDSQYNIRKHNLEKNAKFMDIIQYLDKNLDNLNNDAYYSYISLIFSLNSKNILILKKESTQRAVEKGKIIFAELIENTDIYKTLNFYSILGYFTSLQSKNWIGLNLNALANINSNTLSRIMRRFSLWNKMTILNNFTIGPILNHYLTVKDIETIAQRAKMYRAVCEIDSKTPSEINHGRFLRQLTLDFTINEDFFSKGVFNNITEGIIHMKNSRRNEIIEILHHKFIEYYDNSFGNFTSDHLILYMTYISRAGTEAWINFTNIETLLNAATESSAILNCKVDQILSILAMFKVKNLDTSKYIEKTFDIIKNNFHLSPYNENSKTFKNILQNENPSLIEIIGENLFSSKSEEIEKSIELKKLLFYLMPVSNFCKENQINILTDSILKLINKIENEKQYIYVLNDWVENKMEYVAMKYKLAIGDAFLTKFNMSYLKGLNDKAGFKFLINVTDLAYSKKNESIKKIFYEIFDGIKEIPYFRENIIKNLYANVAMLTPISNFSLTRITNVIKENYNNKEVDTRSIETLLNIAQNILMARNVFNINTEYIQYLVNFIDLHAFKISHDHTLSFFRIQQIIKSFGRNNISSKYLDSLAYKKIIEIHPSEYKEDKFNLISEMLESSINVEEKRNLVKRFFSEQNFDSENLNLNLFSPNAKIFFIKIIALSNKLSAETISDVTASAVINSIKDLKDDNTLDPVSKLLLLINLGHFKPKLIFEDLKNNIFISDIKEIVEKLPIKLTIKRLDELFPNKGFMSIYYSFITAIAHKYEKIDKFDKNLFLKTLDMVSKSKIYGRKFYNKIIEQYSINFENFNYTESLQVINFFSRIFLVKHDILESTLSKISSNFFDDTLKFNLFTTLSRLDYFRSESQIEYVKNVLEDLLPILQKGESYLNFQLLLSLLYSKTYHKDFYNKNIDFIIEKFNHIKDKIQYKFKLASPEEILLLRRLSIFDKYAPEIQTLLREKFEIRQEQIKKNYFTRVSLEILKLLNYSKIIEVPDDIPCTFLMPERKMCVILITSKDTMAFEETPNMYSKIAENEIHSKGHNLVLINVNTLKNILNDRNSSNLVSFFEDCGIANLNVDKKYDFSDLEKVAFSMDKITEVEIEDAEDIGEKIKV